MAKRNIPEPPKPERYGKLSGSFGKPMPKPGPDQCRHCGATPPCRPHKTGDKS